MRISVVCEHLDEAAEPETVEPIGTPCSRCRAPTERVEILAWRTHPVALNPHAAAFGRLGRLEGGPARAAALSPERRRAIARRAARKRRGYDE